MLRSIGAIALGLVVAFLLVTVFEFASLATMPPGIDPMSGPDSLVRAIEAGQIPFISMLLVVLGYVAGSFGGGWVSEKVARQWPMRHALIIGGLLTLAGISNLVSIPHPTWMAIATVVAFLPPAYLGGRLALRGKGVEAAVDAEAEAEASAPPA